MTGAFFIGAMGLGIAGISAWMEIRGKCADGWAFVAVVLIFTSCTKSSGG